jgi:hypothetical protein
MKKLIGFVILLTIMTSSASEKPSYKPKDGFVPDKETAICIAEAVWIPIYGKVKIESEKPFEATLTKGVWTVRSTLREGNKGGVAIAEISKKDAKILRVIHEK